MSVEEEVELRDMVAQTLELNGCLSKIRAQLRANIFLALDEDSKTSKQQPMLNKKIKTYLEMPEGEVMFSLVREFLEFFDLDFSISVYEPESYLGSYYKYDGRQSIIDKLGLKSVGQDIPGPLLLHLVKIAQTNSKTLKINLTNNNGLIESDETNSVVSIQNEINANGKSHSSESSLDNSKEDAINQTDPSKTALKFSKDTLKVTRKADATYIKKYVENDDTFNGTSSIEEESVSEIDNSLDNSNKKNNGIKSDDESSPESKTKSSDKTSKLSHKSEKLKAKLDIPPLQHNKSRVNDILPSLYNKDFKDRSNKDFGFDINDDYEEDFMSGSEVEFSLNKIDCAKPLLEELQQNEKSDNCTSNSCVLSMSRNKTSPKSKSDKVVNVKVNSGTKSLSENAAENTAASESINEEINSNYSCISGNLDNT